MGIKLREVPYHRQKRDYWCGPAALQMFVSAVTGVALSQQRAAQMCGTTRKSGTTIPGLRRGAHTAGLRTRDKRNATLAQMRKILRRGKPVVVLYREPEDNDQHIAVVTGLDRQRITLHDPQHGKNFPLVLDEFVRRWKVWGRWMWMMWPVGK